MKKLIDLFYRIGYARYGENKPQVGIYKINREDNEYYYYDKKSSVFEERISKTEIGKVRWCDKEFFTYYIIAEDSIDWEKVSKEAKGAIKDFINNETKYLLSSLEKYE